MHSREFTTAGSFARARDAAKSCLELGSQKAPSTHQRCCDTACTRSVTTYCGACNVTTACLPLCATYGEGRSEHRASQAQDGHSKGQLYRKGLLGDGWCCSHRQRGKKAGSNKIFPVMSKKGRDPASCHGGLLEHRSPTQLEEGRRKKLPKKCEASQQVQRAGQGHG